jgi:hypothetical protein
MSDLQSDRSRHFYFWIGRWNVANRRLKRRLEHCDEWIEFPATAVAEQLPGNLGNIDSFHAGAWLPGFVGLTVRLFDRETQLWSIYWTSSARGTFDPPVRGGFEEGVGTFFGDDEHEGTPVRVRFRWTHEGPSAARWEQAFSADGGVTWEVNWIMQMSRIPEEEKK